MAGVHNRDIKKLNNIIAELKATDDPLIQQEIQAEIIKLFDDYLCKYVQILKGASVNLKINDSRKFIFLFLDGPPTTERLSNIRRMFAESFSSWTTEEIKSELIKILLDIVHRYRKFEGRDALLYIILSFRYRVTSFVKKQLGYNLNVEDIETYTDIADSYSQNDTIDVDIITAPSGIFIKLTKYERYLVYCKYIYGLTEVDIAPLICMSISTVSRDTQKLIKRIRVISDNVPPKLQKRNKYKSSSDQQCFAFGSGFRPAKSN